VNGSVLLVGASGPLGRAVTHELAEHRHEVMCVSRSGSAGTERMDVTDTAQSRGFLKATRPAIVVYLARPTVPSDVDSAAAVDSDVASLRRFAAESRDHGVERFIFASSASLYGTTEETPRREGDAVVTDSIYAELKFRSETALDEVAASSNLKVLSLRIFNIYGPGFSQSLVNRLALGHDPIPQVYETDRFVRDYIHVSDVARAFGSAVGAGEADSARLNVGTGIGTSNGKLLELMPKSLYESRPQPGRGSYSIADISRIHSLWGFEPRVTIGSAIRLAERFLH
jgi:UDP-glucose 4-epimerase